MAKKKEKTKKPAYKIHRVYKVEGDKIVDKNRTCPKCGQGVFMARHKDRWHCGKCGYTEFIKSE
ncbi:MAG TPA: 30S ribosomal protein S27ae [Euryarchaeota archaeon]|nr:30S ribosomal protein S27ae [Euryarchaeota archaeon]